MNNLAEVLARPDVWRGDRLAEATLPALATGFGALDAELPGGGWPRGALTELLADGSGLGELSLLLPALAAVREEGGWTLLVAPPHPLHAPAWAAAGVDLSRLVVVCPIDEQQNRAQRATVTPSLGEGAGGRAPEFPRQRASASQADALWALEQALASGAPKAVIGWAPQADARAVRRLQVAAAASSAAAFLFRPLRAAREASAAPLRLALSAGTAGHLAVGILKRRGMPMASPLQLALPRPASWREHGTHTPVAGHPPVHAPAFA